jgi:hypothetical protein
MLDWKSPRSPTGGWCLRTAKAVQRFELKQTADMIVRCGESIYFGWWFNLK